MLRGSDLYENEYHSFPEFKKLDLTDMDGHFIVHLQQFRNKCGIPMTPSPRQDAWTRYEKSDSKSRHYAVKRLSDAGDLFPLKHLVLHTWLQALEYEHFGGVGLYYDTEYKNQHRPMIHLDTRPKPHGIKSVWVRDKGIYYGKNSLGFWQALAKIAESQPKPI